MKRGPERDDIDELTAFAGRYFDSDFPNPGRVGCPSGDALSKAARSGKLPSDDLRSHLFKCSECFGEFREEMELQGQSIGIAHSLYSRAEATLRTHAALSFAILIVLLAASVLLTLFLRQHSETSTPIVAGREGGTAANQETDRPTATDSNRPDKSDPAADTRELEAPRAEGVPANNNSAQQLAANYREIDLEVYARNRGPGGQGDASNERIQLRASLNHLRFRLPEAGQSGRYTVTVKRPNADQTLVREEAESVDGRILKVVLDLRRLERAPYELCVSPAGQAPFCYEIVVSP